jgi:3-hydroxyisobutyrate dehydrogenase-like beta-hydroxyacid dehydrogenase
MSNPNSAKEAGKLKVGFLGLGRMGQGMSKRILEAGHEVVVYDVIQAATKLLGDAGATVAASVGEACKGRDIVVTMLAEDYVVKEVVLGKGGVRDSLPAGSIHLAMGTYSIPTVRMIETEHNKAKQVLVAAPVLGRPDLAATGQLGIVAAGPEEALAKCEPLFQVMGRRTFQAGSKPEHANAIKLANNFVLGCALESMAEGFSFVRKFGVVPQAFYDVMTEGLFAAPAYKVYGKIMVDESYDKVGFTTLLGLKDFNLIMEAADLARVPLPSGNAFRDRLLSAIAHGEGEKDWAVVAREQGRSSGLDK